MDRHSVRWIWRWGIVAALGWWGAGVVSGAPATGNPPLRISFLALDQGESTLLQLPGGKTALIGAGAVGDAPAVARALRSRGIRGLDFVIAATWSPEHVGGFPQLLQQLPVRQLFHNPLYAPGKAGDALFRVAKAREQQGKLKLISASMESATVFFSPPCQLRNVGPVGEMYQRFAGDPACSLVVEVGYDRFSFLSLGDTRQAHQRALWKAVDSPPSGELLQLSRTGAPDALLTSLLKPLGTRIAVVPVPRKSTMQPDRGLLARLKQAGVRTYRTDLRGTVTVTSDGRNTTVKTER